MPEGVVIEPFLDRTKMVNNAISTVEKNLIEGALIVVFVLVFFLGNLQCRFTGGICYSAGHAVCHYYDESFWCKRQPDEFGCIDFGLIVDGAVIIVEAVMHQLHHNKHFAGVN